MSEIAIRAENLSKSYQISHSRQGTYKTLQEDVLRFLKTSLSRNTNTSNRETFWALKDVSFEVKHGEVLGIIGRNGAGKSTLLKVLSRITKPTKGYADIFGRVGSLLEVGTGFHPELTGRENIFLNGAILGMSRRDIQHRFDEIVDFAEVERFLDTPTKRYSSGMYMRLAFAVAAHLEPDVLIVDEVLAVGDAEFQKKCLGKMSEISKGGRTVLFVSHNMAAVSNLCQRVMLLESGSVKIEADPILAIRHYLESRQSHASGMGYVDLSQRINRYGRGEIIIQNVSLLNSENEMTNTFEMGEEIVIEFVVHNLARYPNALLGVSCDSIEGTRIFGVHTGMTGWKFPQERSQLERMYCCIPNVALTPDLYSINLSIVNGNEYLDTVSNCIDINIIEKDVYGTGFKVTKDYGFTYVDATWKLKPEAKNVVIG